MGIRDPRVDAYIGRAPAFAQPVLRHLRDLVHDACPEVAETIRWRMPNCQYRGISAAWQRSSSTARSVSGIR
jgi:hypothetical protein